MFIPMYGVSIFVKKNFRKTSPKKQTFFFIHGFGSTSKDWDDPISLLSTDYQCIAIDLPGFGKSSHPRTDKFYETDFLIQLIHDILDELRVEKVILVGYSMGGRVALQVAKKYPEKIMALVLESSSPGLLTVKERRLRIEKDTELISYIKNNSLEKFFSEWQKQPLFASQINLPPKVQKRILKMKMTSNSWTGLIMSLSNFGQGVMENLWKKLPSINVPVLLLSGKFDSKYTEIQNEMHKLFPNSVHKIIDEAGHNLHLEKPQVFVNLVKEFLQILK